MGDYQFKVNPVQDACQHQGMTKTATKSMPSFVKIAAEPLIKCLKYHGVQYRGFHPAYDMRMHMRGVTVKFVPRLLRDEEKERQIQAYFELQHQLKVDNKLFFQGCYW